MDGKINALATASCTVGIATAAIVLRWPEAGLAAAGCAFGVILPPDLDQEGVTDSERLIIRAGGCWLGWIGWLWVAYWWPYACLVPHRHWMSHLPVVGTLVRLLYLFSPLILIWVYKDWPYPMWLERFAIPMILGLMVADTAHWVMDGFPVHGGSV